MILRSLFRRKARTLLTMIGIAVGVSAVVTMGAMAEGFINSYTTVLSSSGADVIAAQKDSVDVMLSALDESVAAQMAAVPGVEKVSSVLIGLVTTPDVPYFMIYGVVPGEFGMDHYKVVEGEPIHGQRQMILGRTAARSFKKNVGDSFKLLDTSYRITGLYETGQAMEEWGAVIALKEGQEVFKKTHQITFVQIKARRAEYVQGIVDEIERRFPKITASRSANYMDDQMETQLMRAIGGFIGVLASVAGGLIMMNTMLMSVYERTREIGVLRALGWRRRRVLWLILGEALALGAGGGLLGVLGGLALIEAANQTPAVASMLQASVTPALLVQAMGTALALGTVGGLYPAWRASQLQPVEAMRYEGGMASVRSSKPGGGTQGNSLWRLVTRYLPRQRTRTALTASGIGLAVGLVVVLGGITDGFVQQFGAMGNQLGDLTVTEAKASDMSLSRVDERVGRWMTTLPEVAGVSGMLFGVTQMPGASYFIVFGMDPSSYAMRHFAVTSGDRIRSPKDVMLGKVAAENMKKKAGDTIKLLGNTYRVVGIYETGVSYEDGSGVLSMGEAQSALKRPNQVSFYGIKLKEGASAEAVRRQVETRWPQVAVSQSSDFAEKTNDMRTMRSVMNALILVAFFVGGITTLNTMVMSVYERTREIGTLRALGWRKRRVMWMILRESVVLSLLSAVAGIATGVGLGMLIALEPSMGSMLTALYTPGLFAQVLALALALGAVGALYPAWRAASLSPIEALRYE
jgi:ABC-type antimicrobial peptide transport system permease subunit